MINNRNQTRLNSVPLKRLRHFRVHATVALCTLLLGCGSSGYSSNQGTPTPGTPTTPTAPTTPTSEVAPAGTCSANQLIVAQDVSGSGDTASANTPARAIDNDLDTFWLSAATDANVTVDLGATYQVNEVRIAWYEGKNSPFTYDLAGSVSGTSFYEVAEGLQTTGTTDLPESQTITATNLRYLKLSTNFNSGVDAGIKEVFIFGCNLAGGRQQVSTEFDLATLGLDVNLPPSGNFDLLIWGLDNPEDNDNNGRSDRIQERELAAGFTNEFFYTGSDGGMVFKAPIYAPKTSTNTSYARTELREMLRRGNTSISTQGPNLNNWVLGYQPEPTNPVGGVGGHLSATLAVNQVVEAGDNYQIGRVIIGQIHAGDDEPIRLYYRKRPGHDLGYIYFAHEINGGDDTIRMVYGPEYSNQNNQPNFSSAPNIGIGLDEVFSYEIIQRDARIDVLIRKGGLSAPIVGHQSIDMDALNSGYDVQGEWMYFKAGAYTGNNTGAQGDFFQVTFYALENSHN